MSDLLQPPPGGGPPDEFRCELLDGFAVVIQVVMASIALSSLILKRQREYPRRPFVVWALDTSKQAVAAGMVHFANIAIAYVSDSKESDNPCIWYFLNILLDTTLGVGILALFLHGLHYAVDYLKIPDMKSGHYGNPPRISAWFRQLLLFITAWFFVKLTVVFLLKIFPFFAVIAGWLLDPLVHSGDTRLQVVVVMLIFPLIMNIIQAWLIDMVIKGKSQRVRLRSGSVGNESEVDSLEDNEDLVEDVEDHLGDFVRIGGEDTERGIGPEERRGRLTRHSSGSSQPLLKVHKSPSRKSPTQSHPGKRTPFGSPSDGYSPVERQDNTVEYVDLDEPVDVDFDVPRA
ncbi:uncharacterized protein SPPG_02777 [Spizellomyces punctatus DAOM BR117]|uniref:Vaculolar membrane protein n=1 Tax=Spizellomyces punctatus (strain DAOM BR117) TaxID=645134 RepID=A0A0L0HMK5_SPIPD|nr:uncharacterized protein SPPG_02777 [Spizellomyces punctatus DAOM BR117]KND02303.1 hypothetical protein SPPG_02777 [Spizellomyces punctatus DAOM BR117]|eukprot:XP_016610342.1 hypothetical protein SPPG_02777 [Spizellomyces punctatus DAOM BR117]